MNDDRRMELEIEVPGTPEEVWEAIATGPGITSWLHPTEVEEREGGELSFDMGWRHAVHRPGGRMGPAPPLRRGDGVEGRRGRAARCCWPPSGLVEARSGGTCVVRMVTTGFGTGAAWDEEIEGFTGAMRAALDVLRAYLTHFPRRHGSWMRAFGQGEGSLDEVWSELTAALGVDGAAAGEPVTVGEGPSLTGVVEREARGPHLRDLLIRLEDPGPGLAQIGVFSERRFVAVQACLYGDEGAAVAEREQPAWEAWMQERFAS